MLWVKTCPTSTGRSRSGVLWAKPCAKLTGKGSASVHIGRHLADVVSLWIFRHGHTAPGALRCFRVSDPSNQHQHCATWAEQASKSSNAGRTLARQLRRATVEIPMLSHKSKTQGVRLRILIMWVSGSHVNVDDMISMRARWEKTGWQRHAHDEGESHK